MAPTGSDFFDDSDASVHIEHQYESGTPPSIAIVRAIAAIENADPMDSSADLGITLYDHIDPAALDELVAKTTDSSELAVQMTLHNDNRYAVRVEETGHLVVEKADRDG